MFDLLVYRLQSDESRERWTEPWAYCSVNFIKGSYMQNGFACFKPSFVNYPLEHDHFWSHPLQFNYWFLIKPKFSVHFTAAWKPFCTKLKGKPTQWLIPSTGAFKDIPEDGNQITKRKKMHSLAAGYFGIKSFKSNNIIKKLFFSSMRNVNQVSDISVLYHPNVPCCGKYLIYRIFISNLKIKADFDELWCHPDRYSPSSKL